MVLALSSNRCYCFRGHLIRFLGGEVSLLLQLSNKIKEFFTLTLPVFIHLNRYDSNRRFSVSADKISVSLVLNLLNNVTKLLPSLSYS